MFVAALLCCCDRMWISIFSTGKRASKSLLMQVKEIIDTIPGMSKRITSSNVEELWMNPIGCSKKVQEARCFSYPSSVKVSQTNAGKGCLLFYCKGLEQNSLEKLKSQ